MRTLKNFRWQRTFIILVSMGALSTLSFNCAPSLMQAADYSYLNQGSTAGLDTFEMPKDSPWVLQNTFQVFASMANVTGQAGAVTANQLAEYDARAGAMSQTDKITDINAPLQMAASSLAGEFCNGLIAREQAAMNRIYFTGVNFAANLAGNTTQAYANAVGAMAQGFWGRAIKPEEISIMQSYYNDFVSSAGANVNQTRALYLATCAAMLASFDTITY
jgi:hypothetical protein